jgi:hypothetical protein
MEKVLMAVCAAALAGFAVLRFVQVLRWGRAEARCLGLPGGDLTMWTGREVPVAFRTAAGREVRAQLRIYDRGWAPTHGRGVRIRYDPADPARIMSETSILVWPAIAAVCGALAGRLLLLAAGV